MRSSFWEDLFVPMLSEGEQNRSLHSLKKQLLAMQSRSADSRREGQAARGDLREELDVLQANFARTLLLLHALTTTLLRKQLITKGELQALIRELDLLDGQADNSLDPAALPGMKPQPEPRSTETVLDRLAKQLPAPEPSPREFLQRLEEQ
jgi:hypothetical protein